MDVCLYLSEACSVTSVLPLIRLAESRFAACTSSPISAGAQRSGHPVSLSDRDPFGGQHQALKHKLQLLRYVVDLLYNKLYNELYLTSLQRIESSQQMHNKLYKKFTKSRKPVQQIPQHVNTSKCCRTCCTTCCPTSLQQVEFVEFGLCCF